MKSVKISIYIVLTIVSIMGCTKDSKDLTVIDGFVLGIVEDSLKSQFNKLQIQKDRFFTSQQFSSLSEADQNQLSFYYTKLFNLSKYMTNNDVTNHYGMYYPMTMEGTTNIIGVAILLGHTDSSFLVNHEVTNLTNDYGIKYFDQNVRFDLVNKIESMLREKYGEPDEIIESDFFYDIEGADIISFTTEKNLMGKELIWRKKSIDIRYFKGFENYNVVYNDSNNNLEGYLYHIDDNNDKRTLREKDIYSQAFPYIIYQINKEGIKTIEENEIKL